MAAQPVLLRFALVASLSFSGWACGGLAGEASSDPELPPELAELLEAQQALPGASVAALQDLRLVAAVQLTYFTEKGRYETPEKLQQDAYLDPEWPRSPAESYRVHCVIKLEGAAFVCFADALEPELDWYMTDSTQAVRRAAGARPTAQSPVFGVGEEE